MAVMMLYGYNQQLDDLFMVQSILLQFMLYTTNYCIQFSSVQCNSTYNIKILLFTVVTPCEKEVDFSILKSSLLMCKLRLGLGFAACNYAYNL